MIDPNTRQPYLGPEGYSEGDLRRAMPIARDYPDFTHYLGTPSGQLRQFNLMNPDHIKGFPWGGPLK